MMPRTHILLSVAAVLAWAAWAIAPAGHSQATAGPPPTTAPSPATAPAAEPLELVYLFSPTCVKCAAASKLVDGVASRYGGTIQVRRLNIQDSDALEQVLVLEERYQAKPAAPPRIFVGSTCLTGLDAITERLAAEVSRAISSAASQPETSSSSQPE